jgi:hypothetical protein
VTDFGVGKAIAESAPEAVSLTGAHFAPGTQACITPPMTGADPNVDERVDFYCSGVFAFELLTRLALLHAANAAHVVNAHLTEPEARTAQRHDDVAGWLEPMLARGRVRRPDDRSQSVDERS